MMKRLETYLAASPRRAAEIVLVLLVVLVFVVSMVAVQSIVNREPPYPSDDLPISLVSGRVVYEQTTTTAVAWGDSSVPFNYTGMRVGIQVDWSGVAARTAGPFGNQTFMSTGSSATMEQWLMQGSDLNLSILISESTGDGSFNAGDNITFNIDPLSEDVIYTFGLYWPHPFGMTMSTEMSFAIHDGHLYKWLSQYLPTQDPWWD